MEWIFNQLRERPELAIFLTIFLGFWLGKLRIGKFTLGTVTSVLLVGVLVGQLNIAVPGPIKSVFFLLFLFAVGYKVGPPVLPRTEKGRITPSRLCRTDVCIRTVSDLAAGPDDGLQCR